MAAYERTMRRAAPALLLLLAGCSALRSPPATIPGMRAPRSVDDVCLAPAPNLRAAYNRPYSVRGRNYQPLTSTDGYDRTGIASWYGYESGSTTAMGVAFNPALLTAASRALPLPTCVRVTNLRNGRSITVLVDDRGPFVDGRILDLSKASADALGIQGTAEVRIVAGAAATGDLGTQSPAALQAAPAEVGVIAAGSDLQVRDLPPLRESGPHPPDPSARAAAAADAPTSLDRLVHRLGLDDASSR